MLKIKYFVELLDPSDHLCAIWERTTIADRLHIKAPPEANRISADCVGAMLNREIS